MRPLPRAGAPPDDTARHAQDVDLPDLIPLTAIALAAGERILEIYEGDFAVAYKADNSPVTRADTEAEAIILAGLAKTSPNIPVVAEESVAAGRTPEISETFFLVDPLDGSKEFIARNGEFTVNIALIENGVPVAGIVYAPALGRIWTGDRDQGSFAGRVEGNAVIDRTPICIRPAGDQLCAIGSRSHGSGEGDPRLGHFAISAFKSIGSSLKFCLLAAGEADLYPRFSRTMEWDTAAGDAILRAAGGQVACLDGTPLTYGKRNQPHDSDFANPHFIAYGDPALARSGAAKDEQAS